MVQNLTSGVSRLAGARRSRSAFPLSKGGHGAAERGNTEETYKFYNIFTYRNINIYAIRPKATGETKIVAVMGGDYGHNSIPLVYPEYQPMIQRIEKQFG